MWNAAASRRPEAATWLLLGGLGILAVTGWRVGMLALSQAELLTDESQYWLYGRELAFGHFSKPPLLGWIIEATTRLAGADSAFHIRLAAPLMHAATALAVMALTRALACDRAAALAGLSYATLPAVALGSSVISTDTPMVLCLALALLAWMHAARAPGGSLGAALGIGLALGLGFLAKWAILYTVAGLAVAAALVPAWRIRPRDAAVAAAVAAALAAPNLWWNAQHGFATARHIADDAQWQGFTLNLLGTAEYLAAQMGVAGPILFPAIVIGWAAALRRGADPRLRGLALASATVLAIVAGQALLSRANANWGASAYVGGTVVGTLVLMARPRLLAASLGLGIVASLALPISATFGTGWQQGDGRLLLRRHVGRAEVSLRTLEAARTAGLDIIVAEERPFLADLFYRARTTATTIRALPLAGPAPTSGPTPGPTPGPVRHHYDLIYPLSADQAAGPVLLVGFAGTLRRCDDGTRGTLVDGWEAGPGWAQGQRLELRAMPPGCWRPGGQP